MAIGLCLDCAWHKAAPLPTPIPDDFVCIHFRPDYWVEQGFKRNWGDAAVGSWPKLEILRKEEGGRVEYVILAPLVTRRPVRIYADRNEANEGRQWSWGSY